MAICPFAVQQLIPETYSQGEIDPTTLIFHEAVSSADSLREYWNSAGVEVESHFYIGRTGVIYQFVDTNVRADANMYANGFAISVETWDDSNRNPLLGWNAEMVAACKRLAAWVCDTHGVRKGPATSWNGGGIGGHNWFPDPWAGGPRQCPGETRNSQLRNDIIPAVASGQLTQEDELQPDERNALLSTHAAIYYKGGSQGDQSIIDRLVEVQLLERGNSRKLDALLGRPAVDVDEDHLAQALAPLLQGIPDEKLSAFAELMTRRVNDEADRRERERLAVQP